MAQMTDAEFQAWLDQHGGEVGRKDIEDDVDDPSGARDSNGNIRKIKRIDRTEVTAKDGATITLRRAPGSLVSNPDAPQYDVTGTTPPKAAAAQKPTNVYIGTNPTTGKPTQVSEFPDGHKEYDDTQVPAAQAGEAPPPKEKDEGGVRYQWQPNPGGPNAGGKWVPVGSAPETPAERQAREANAPTQTVARVKGGDGQEYTVVTIVPKPGQPGSPGQVVLGPNGQPAPNGVPGAPAQEKKETVKGPDGKTYIRVTVAKPDGTVDLYHTDQSGARATFPDEPVPGAGLKNVPAYTPDYTNPNGLGVIEYAAELRKKVGLPAAQGGITQQEYEAAVKEAHTAATNAISTVQAAATQEGNTLTARRAETARRQQQASSDFTAGQNANKEMWKYTKPGQLTLDQMAMGSVAANRAVQQGYGGTEDVPYPSLLNPWVEKMRASLAGTTGAPTAVPAAAGVPAQNGPAVGPVAAGVTATNAAAVNPTGPNVQAANDAVMAGSGAAFGAAGIPAPPPAGAAIPAPAVAGPVSMAPPDDNPWGQNAQRWMAGRLDPGQAAMSLKAIGIPDDVIGQVLAGGGFSA